MASLFGHVAASTAIGYAFFPKQVRPIALVVAGFCAFSPDLDVLGFRLGVPYASEWGHRGFTHSIAFALVVGGLIGWICTRGFSRTFLADGTSAKASALITWFVLSMASHPLLDMLTNGGRGCALWWPFSNARLFFPFRPVQVSPLTVQDFFTPWGLEVLASEVLWIGFPCVALVWMMKFYRSMSPNDLSNYG